MPTVWNFCNSLTDRAAANFVDDDAFKNGKQRRFAAMLKLTKGKFPSKTTFKSLGLKAKAASKVATTASAALKARTASKAQAASKPAAPEAPEATREAATAPKVVAAPKAAAARKAAEETNATAASKTAAARKAAASKAAATKAAATKAAAAPKAAASKAATALKVAPESKDYKVLMKGFEHQLKKAAKKMRNGKEWLKEGCSMSKLDTSGTKHAKRMAHHLASHFVDAYPKKWATKALANSLSKNLPICKEWRTRGCKTLKTKKLEQALMDYDAFKKAMS